ncbi:MAG: CPBP family intramembrane metalloprotease [Acidobacteriaceae bacterium]|nr:CPBP family intramembrane metalloprotease [Acidobacteriaceae bacterium]
MRPFFITLACSWFGLFVVALFYSKQHPQSHWIMTAALPAFLVEAVFYLASGFENTLSWFGAINSRRAQAGMLWISALLPYLIFSFASGTFQRNAFYLLTFLAGMLSFWYAVLPRRFAYDLGFLVIAAAPVITRVFQRIYRSPDDHLRIDVLGHLMWIRIGIAALLVLRGWDPGAFSFWPTRDEWRTGILYYLLFVVPIIAVALGLHDARFDPMRGEWWRIGGIALGTFFGILWVVALGEELFFRGVIERALLNRLGSSFLAVALSSLLFGVAHLWFHAYPDWRRAIVATVLGVACGLVYLRTDSIRAPMVTHAFVVTTWRMFFR